MAADGRAVDPAERTAPLHHLPDWLARLTTGSVYALVAGVVLVGLSLLTNPVPDPSYPWATLPARFRVAYAQPRIEHWPVTYTVGLWLVVFSLPLVFVAAYRRCAPGTDSRPSVWLAAAPVTAMLAFTTYCRFFWPRPNPATWNAPSYTFVCWLYCSTYDPLWSNLAYAVALFGVAATALAFRESPRAKHALAAFGVLALPLGAPALLEAYRRHVQ